MPSRLDRYEETKPNITRVNKNQNLYDEKDNGYKLVSMSATVLKKEETPKKEEKEDVVKTEKLSSLYEIDLEKEHDINKVLKDAKKNRTDVDDLETRRKLKKKEYNIVQEIGLKKIEEIKEQRKQSVTLKEEDEEELKELIDTIYSNTLASEVNKRSEELFSDLMPTDDENTIINEELTKEMIENEKKIQQEKEEDEKTSDLDDSFFTESNRFEKEDLKLEEKEEDEEDFFDEEDTPRWVMVPIILAVLIVVGLIAYLLYTGV